MNTIYIELTPEAANELKQTGKIHLLYASAIVLDVQLCNDYPEPFWDYSQKVQVIGKAYLAGVTYLVFVPLGCSLNA